MVVVVGSCLRGKVTAFANDQRDVDVVAGGDLAHFLCEVVVLLLVERIELLVVVNGDDGHSAPVFEAEDRRRGHGAGCQRDYKTVLSPIIYSSTKYSIVEKVCVR